jgi:hypothetical protein
MVALVPLCAIRMSPLMIRFLKDPMPAPPEIVPETTKSPATSKER